MTPKQTGWILFPVSDKGFPLLEPGHGDGVDDPWILFSLSEKTKAYGERKNYEVNDEDDGQDLNEVDDDDEEEDDGDRGGGR